MTAEDRVEELLRRLAPQVLGVLVRRLGQFDACEDAVQEALLAAAVQWPAEGVPESPRGWLVTVASRRAVDELRSERARRRREDTVAARVPSGDRIAPAPGDERLAERDDTLTLLLLCCHPALSPASQVALTLRAVGGLTTAEIARAFLVPEANMAQRISRAKQRIKATGIPFALPPEAERRERLDAVLHVLYLIFTEGYTASSGPVLHRAELTGEAIRLTRELRRLVPGDPEVSGLLALMLLTDARRPARTRPDGGLVPLAEQDRARWSRALIDEGTALVSDALTRSPLGPYQLQAAIAAVHAEAARAQDTDWRQIAALYELLERFGPTRWSRSTAPSRSGWCTGRRPGSSSSRRSRPTSASRPTTASRPCARTCSSGPATTRPRARATASRLGAPRASPSSATSRRVPRGWRSARLWPIPPSEASGPPLASRAMDIEFIASIAVIAPEPERSRDLYLDALGLPLEANEGDDYFHSERIAGSKHFGVWPLSQAAHACFGTPQWPGDRPVPQASVEFEVADADAVAAAGDELEAAGFELLHRAREEPWGQTVARLQSAEGAIIGISYAPWLHD